jgi:hypothetical protein
LRRRLRAAVLLGGRGGGRLPDADAAPARAVAGPSFLTRLRLDRVRVERRASRMMNQPIAMITSTPAMKSPKTPAVLTVGSLEFVFELFGVLGVVFVGGGAGVGWAGVRGPKAPPPPGAGAGVGVGAGAGAPVCAAASGAPIRSATSAARRVARARNGYWGGDVPPEFGGGLGAGVPPLFGSLGFVPDGVPGLVPGLAGAGAGAGVPVEGAAGAGVPVLGVALPEPPMGAPPPPFFAFLFFF